MIWGTEADNQSDTGSTNQMLDGPSVRAMRCFCEYLWETGGRYNGTALYIVNHGDDMTLKGIPQHWPGALIVFINLNTLFSSIFLGDYSRRRDTTVAPIWCRRII